MYSQRLVNPIGSRKRARCRKIPNRDRSSLRCSSSAFRPDMSRSMNSAPSHGYKLDHGTPSKIDDHLMMFQSLAALDWPQVPNNAVMAALIRATWQPLKCLISRGCTRPRFRQSMTGPNQTQMKWCRQRISSRPRHTNGKLGQIAIISAPAASIPAPNATATRFDRIASSNAPPGN